MGYNTEVAHTEPTQLSPIWEKALAEIEEKEQQRNFSHLYSTLLHRKYPSLQESVTELNAWREQYGDDFPVLDVSMSVSDLLEECDSSLIKQAFPTSGNTINYVANIVEALTKSGPDHDDQGLVEQVEQTEFDNLYTAIAEHPLADATGEYRYTARWSTAADGRTKLTSSVGGSSNKKAIFIEDIIKRSIDDPTGQVPDFEKHRNRMNLKFYQRLEEARNSSDPQRRGANHVEFSPSPDIDLPGVKERGYMGNDSVLVYRLDEDGNEQVTQYWFPGINLDQYRDLFESIGISAPEHLSEHLSDIDVMAASGAVNESQLTEILRFIETNQNRSQALAAEVEEEISQEFRDKIANDVMPIVWQAVNLLAEADLDEEAVRMKLEEIYGQISKLQFMVRLYLRDYAQADTFTTLSRDDEYGYNNISYQEFALLTQEEQLRKVSEIGYQAAGCGFAGTNGGGSGVFDWSFASAMVWGKSDSALYPGLPTDFGEPHPGNCIGCGQFHNPIGGCDLCVECHFKAASERPLPNA